VSARALLASLAATAFVALLAGIWLGGRPVEQPPAGSPSLAPPQSRQAPTPAGREPARVAVPEPAPPVARAPAAEPPEEPPARPRRDLPYEVEEQVRRYEEAEDPGEKAEVLIELALSSDEPVVLEFLLEELESEPADMQEPLLDAIVQFGDRAAVPTLRAMAERTTSEERRRRLRETADYLELPTLTEIRKELENR
jgi:hypothetical protein